MHIIIVIVAHFRQRVKHRTKFIDGLIKKGSVLHVFQLDPTAPYLSISDIFVPDGSDRDSAIFIVLDIPIECVVQSKLGIQPFRR
jgi:hypothetical protein